MTKREKEYEAPSLDNPNARVSPMWVTWADLESCGRCGAVLIRNSPAGELHAVEHRAHDIAIKDIRGRLPKLEPSPCQPEDKLHVGPLSRYFDGPSNGESLRCEGCREVLYIHLKRT